MNPWQRISSLRYDRRNPLASQIRKILIQRIDYTEYAYPETVRECDDLFIDRWHRNRLAFRQSFWSNHFEIEGVLSSGVLEDGLALDFGCGTGNIDIELAKRGHRIIGIDLSPKAIQIANLYREQLAPDEKQRIIFLQGDIATIHLDTMPSVALMIHVLEHLLEPALIFTALWGGLTRDGRIWVSVPHSTHYDDPGHVHHFGSQKDLEEFLSAYGRVESTATDEEHHVIRAILRHPEWIENPRGHSTHSSSRE